MIQVAFPSAVRQPHGRAGNVADVAEAFAEVDHVGGACLEAVFLEDLEDEHTGRTVGGAAGSWQSGRSGCT